MQFGKSADKEKQKMKHNRSLFAFTSSILLLLSSIDNHSAPAKPLKLNQKNE